MAGRTALITGAGANVGKEIARRLAARDDITRVIVNDVNQERATVVADEIRAEFGTEATAITADVTDWGAVRRMFDDAGGVDILVNNAGIPPSPLAPKKFVDTQPEDWSPWINLNLFGVLYTVRAALPHMIESGWGRIVTIISDAGRTGEPRMAAYGAGKAGAGALTRSVAKEVGRSGITLNNVALGSLRHAAEAVLTPEQIQVMLKSYIVPRLGESEDPAALVEFLTGDSASWISGQTIAVNGGYTVTL